MARQLTKADCATLYKQFKLNQQQIDSFEAAYLRASTFIGKPELLKIYSYYNFNAEQLEEHLRQYQAKLKKDEKVVGCTVKMPEKISCNMPMKVSYEIMPDGSVRNFSLYAVIPQQ